MTGSLVVVGTGIQFGVQTTPEARNEIERADKVLYLFVDPVPVEWIKRLNPTAESLDRFYGVGKRRRQTYSQIVEEIMRWVRAGAAVCAVFYGHPGVFVTPSHDAIARAREEGFAARMLPGVSAEDCLFADLGLDPGDAGCQSFEATSFLLYQRTVDTSVPLILWQVGAIGEHDGVEKPRPEGFAVLLERLVGRYGEDHEVMLYQAVPYPMYEPKIERARLRDIDPAQVGGMATLYVPPKSEPTPNLEMFDRLGVRHGSPGRSTGT